MKYMEIRTVKDFGPVGKFMNTFPPKIGTSAPSARSNVGARSIRVGCIVSQYPDLPDATSTKVSKWMITSLMGTIQWSWFRDREREEATKCNKRYCIHKNIIIMLQLLLFFRAVQTSEERNSQNHARGPSNTGYLQKPKICKSAKSLQPPKNCSARIWSKCRKKAEFDSAIFYQKFAITKNSHLQISSVNTNAV
jgi:hypothetical protein